MITKKFLIALALLALAAVSSVAGSAGQVVIRKVEPKPLKIQGPVSLGASPADYFGAGGTPVTLVIANNTDTVIPAGTTIYWSIKHRKPSNPTSWTETKGSLTAGLAKTGQLWLRWPIPPVEGPYTTKAWYLPWAVPK